MKAVEDFFAVNWPWEHKRELKSWQYCVINEDCFKDQHEAGSLLLFYDINLRLMEALDLLLVINNDKWPTPKDATKEQIEQEKRDWVYFPKNLSAKEEANPYIAVRKCFKRISPYEYREHLHNWLHFALSDCCSEETLTTYEIFQLSKNLRKLYAAAWLIYMRESELPPVRGIKSKGNLEDKTDELQEEV
ncbi:hypothetical protein [Desertivirga arenae]|uniref:hypothetical protein n=1 Tax=Desertivirga arenae TaxID=2810309 RepID=UPI001A9641E8|nr:hypothetical protein [Pedobacter sp. SYSU D00823]